MAPPASIIASQLRQLIYYNLDNSLNSNALFLAERLAASERTAESAYLTSLCHLRLGDNRSAHESSRLFALKGGHLGCAYIFGQASLALEQYKDGITALEKTRSVWHGRNCAGKHNQTRRDPYPDAAAVHCLLGKLHHGNAEKKEAIKHFEEALKLNPFMWDAFTLLCDMGANVRVPNIFKLNSELDELVRSTTSTTDAPQSKKEANLMALMPEHPHIRSGTRSAPVVADTADPFNNVPTRGFAGGLFSSMGLSHKTLNESNPSSMNLAVGGNGGSGFVETPNGPSIPMDSNLIPSGREPGVVSAYALEPPRAPPRNRTLQASESNSSMEAPPRPGRSGSTKRSAKHDPFSDAFSDMGQSSRSAAMPVIGGDKKRTISGQTVHQRPSQTEDPNAAGTSNTRRSVRLFNQFNQITRASSNRAAPPAPTPAMARDTRDARKAKAPPMSKIMRTGGASAGIRVVSGNRKPVEDGMDIDQKEGRLQMLPPHLNGTSNFSRLQSASQADSLRLENESMQWLLDLFKKLGHGYYHLSQYQCQEAVHVFNTLPSAQLNTPWVLSQLGRSYYEQAAYADAGQYYKRILNIAPSRLQDMEIYSTILWHLKKETDLSFLAHELIDADWHSPQAWCALGNAWSLSRDHETALRCFKRATQLNPKFAYAFTLQGHEHVANEEFDKALLAYRHSMAADKRHYNAYYGIGKVYEKLGQYEKAFQHYSAASTINPTNAVLICCLGTILEKQKQPKQALRYFSKATDMAPRSALTRFKKARALMALNHLDLALQELMVLKDLAPDEAMVHFLLGRLYKGMREKGLAVKHFTIALNLDPKASQQIKEAIESLEVEAQEHYDGDSMIV